MDARALGKGWGSFPEAGEPYEYLPFPRVSCVLCLFPPSLLPGGMGSGAGPKGLNTHPGPPLPKPGANCIVYQSELLT